MLQTHRFRGGFKHPFSNFYKAECIYEGLTFQNTEAAFQSAKTLDPTQRKCFQNLSPSESKRLGRAISLRPDWEAIKYQVMVDVLISKFEDQELKQLLLDTGDDWLIEDTTGWHDNEWGDCTCEKCQNIVGNNLLGKALVEVRDLIKK